jgi:hypothetical protein
MSKFLNYRGVDFQLENEDFYATNVSLSAQASVDPVILSDGSLLNYAPSSAVVGSLSCDFYLTAALPSYLNITGTHDTPIKAKFANVEIAEVYPKNISFSVEPFQPVLISAEFDWYGDVKVENFEEQGINQVKQKQVPNYIAHSYKSYLSSRNIFNSDYSGPSGPTGPSGPQGSIVSFSYRSSCDRPTFFNVDEVVPFRVGKLNKQCEVDLSANNLGKLISVNGKNASSVIYLKDFYGTSLSSFSIDGVLSNQNYNVSEGQYLLTEASIRQTITETKTLI